MRTEFALLLASLSLLPTALAAQTPARQTVAVDEAQQYFAVLPGYFVADKGRQGTSGGITLSGIYGYRWTPHWGVEANLMGSTIETGSDQGTDFYQQGAVVDLVYGLRDRGEGWTPFVLAGLGAVQNDVIPDSEDAISMVLNLGVGLVSSPVTSLGFKLRAEGRYQRDSFQGDYNDY